MTEIYDPQTWNNLPIGGTPLSASRLAYIEAGIEALDDLQIANDRVAPDAGIEYSKLDLVGSITLADLAFDIATQAEMDAHRVDTTNIHGIADTSALIVNGDARLSDQRIPTDDSVTNAKVADNAAIEYGKLDLLGAVTLADLAFDPVTDAELTTEASARATADTAEASARTAADEAHRVDTTAVHGIADTTALVLTNDARMNDQRVPLDATVTTSKIVDGAVTLAKIAVDLATQAELNASASAATAALTAHDADTTGIHGIVDTTALVLTDDARLTNTRTPTDNTVTTAKLVDGAVTLAKIAFDISTQVELDAGLALKISKAGDTMTGDLELAEHNIVFLDRSLAEDGSGYLGTDLFQVSDHLKVGSTLYAEPDGNIFGSINDLDLRAVGDVYVTSQGANTVTLRNLTSGSKLEMDSTGKLTFDDDTSIWRADTATLQTDAIFYMTGEYNVVSGVLNVGGNLLVNLLDDGSKVLFGSAQDTEIFRSAIGTLRTSGKFAIGSAAQNGVFTIQGTLAAADTNTNYMDNIVNLTGTYPVDGMNSIHISPVWRPTGNPGNTIGYTGLRLAATFNTADSPAAAQFGDMRGVYANHTATVEAGKKLWHLKGFESNSLLYGAGTYENVYGFRALIGMGYNGCTVNSYKAFYAAAPGVVNTIALVQDMWLFVGNAPDPGSNIVNLYGLHLSNLTGVSTNAWAIKTDGGKVFHAAGAANVVPLTIQGHTGQTADLFVAQDVTPVARFKIGPAGRVGHGVGVAADLQTNTGYFLRASYTNVTGSPIAFDASVTNNVGALSDNYSVLGFIAQAVLDTTNAVGNSTSQQRGMHTGLMVQGSPGTPRSLTGSASGLFVQNWTLGNAPMTLYQGARLDFQNFGTGTITDYQHMRILNPSGTGPITTLTGLYIENQTKGATNYAIQSNGKVVLSAGVAANQILTLKGAASQTGDYQRWEDSVGVYLARFRATGDLTFNVITDAPVPKSVEFKRTSDGSIVHLNTSSGFTTVGAETFEDMITQWGIQDTSGHQFRQQMESHWFDGTQHQMEWNLRYLPPGGSEKGFMGFNVNRSTHLGAWLFVADAATGFRVEGKTFFNGQMVLDQAGVDTTQLKLTTTIARTANYMEVRDASDVLIFNANNFGLFYPASAAELRVAGALTLTCDTTANGIMLRSIDGAQMLWQNYVLSFPNGLASITLPNNGHLVFGTGGGTKIGTATGQKIGFWNATPVAQPVLATGAGATVDNVIAMLQSLGLCRQS